MGTYKTQIVNNIICSKLAGELDATLSNEWVIKLEEQENGKTVHRLHDVRDVNAVHLNFDDLWGIAQRRLDSYKSGDETRSAFWVSTPLNYGVARIIKH